jgi:hypothetical protein
MKVPIFQGERCRCLQRWVATGSGCASCCLGATVLFASSGGGHEERRCQGMGGHGHLSGHEFCCSGDRAFSGPKKPVSQALNAVAFKESKKQLEDLEAKKKAAAEAKLVEYDAKMADVGSRKHEALLDEYI